MLKAGVLAGANGQLSLEEVQKAQKAVEEAVEQFSNTEDHARMLFLQRSQYKDGKQEFSELTTALDGTRSSLLELRRAAAEKFLLFAPPRPAHRTAQARHQFIVYARLAQQ